MQTRNRKIFFVLLVILFTTNTCVFDLLYRIMLYIGDNFFEKICIRFSFFSFFRSPKKKKNYCCSSVHRNMFSTHLTRIFRCIVIKLKFLRIVRLDFIRFTVWLIIKRNNKIWRERTMLWNCYKDFNKNNFFSIKVFIFNWLLRDFNFYESSVSLSFFLLFLLCFLTMYPLEHM